MCAVTKAVTRCVQIAVVSKRKKGCNSNPKATSIPQGTSCSPQVSCVFPMLPLWVHVNITESFYKCPTKPSQNGPAFVKGRRSFLENQLLNRSCIRTSRPLQPLLSLGSSTISSKLYYHWLPFQHKAMCHVLQIRTD